MLNYKNLSYTSYNQVKEIVKEYKMKGLTTIRLNSKKSDLIAEIIKIQSELKKIEEKAISKPPIIKIEEIHKNKITSAKELNKYLRKESSVIFYAGNSKLDNNPVIGLLYLKESQNSKTGSTVYTTYLPLLSGDYSLDDTQNATVCGDCPLSPRKTGLCYVLGYQKIIFAKHWLPNVHKGRFRLIDLYSPEIINYLKLNYGDLTLRIGNSGDPYSIPSNYNNILKAVFTDTVGYTHQYHQMLNSNNDINALVSTHSIKHTKTLQSKGYRTARVIKEQSSDRLKTEFLCPKQLDDVKNCQNCKLCSMNNNPLSSDQKLILAKQSFFYEDEDIKPSVTFVAHGTRKKAINKLINIT